MFYEVCSESGVSGENAANSAAKLPSIKDGYKPKDITNGDKT
jgi:hypothetical protein